MSKYNKVLDDFITEIRICLCGNPEKFLIVLRDKLKYCKTFLDKGVNSRDLNSPYYSDDSLFIHYVIDTWGLTEHGGSIFRQWLTDKGEEILKILTSLPLEDDDFDIDDYIFE